MSRVLQADDTSFESEVIRAAGPVLVDFSATWCAPCKKLDPLVQEIAGEYDGRLKVVKVDVEQAPQTAAKYGVLSVPTLLFFRDGDVKDQVMGLVTKQALSDRVQKVL